MELKEKDLKIDHANETTKIYGLRLPPKILKQYEIGFQFGEKRSKVKPLKTIFEISTTSRHLLRCQIKHTKVDIKIK